MADCKQKVPTFNLKTKSYNDYRFELDLFIKSSGLSQEIIASKVFLSLPEAVDDESKIKKFITSRSSVDELTGRDGLKKLLKLMDEHLKKDALSNKWELFQDFDNLSRKDGQSVREYITEFGIVYGGLENRGGVTLPDDILGLLLLKRANVGTDTLRMAMTDINFGKTNHVYSQCEKALKKYAVNDLFEERNDGLIPGENYGIKSETLLSEETAEAYYGRGSGREKWRGRGGRARPMRAGGFSQKSADYQNRTSNVDEYGKHVNRPGRDGKPLTCFDCGSIRHMLSECEWNNRKNGKKEVENNQENYTLFTGSEVYTSMLVDESINMAVLDSACSTTVCGEAWMKDYIESLCKEDKEKVYIQESMKDFKFGAGGIMRSSGLYKIPVDIGGYKGSINTEVVSSNIPLLLSLDAMKKANTTNLDFTNDCVTMFGRKVSLKLTSSGHYCMPIHPSNGDVVEAFNVQQLDTEDQGKLKNMLIKIHRQFAHPSPDKMSILIKNSGSWKPNMNAIIKDIAEKCEICNTHKRTPSRPIVCLPLASKFGELVCLDLKKFEQYQIIYMIDGYSRLTIAKLSVSKLPKDIINALLESWVAAGYGVMEKILVDNGGEFDNADFRESCSVLNIKVITTAAQSPWSNGICERNHATVDHMLRKLMEENPKTPIQSLLAWATMAKNSMASYGGFSSYQLVFGRNPLIPNIENGNVAYIENGDGPEIFARHLKALSSARKAYTEAETSEKIKRALRGRIRSYEKKYEVGQTVFYKRDSSEKWLGPAKILIQDGSVSFVRHGSQLIRVNASRLWAPPKDEDDRSEQTVEEAELPETAEEAESPEVIESESEDDESTGNEVPRTLEVPSDKDKMVAPMDGEETNRAGFSCINPSEIKKGDLIAYRCEEDEPYNVVKVISRAGSARGNNKYWWNVEKTGDNEKFSIELSGMDMKLLNFDEDIPNFNPQSNDDDSTIICDDLENSEDESDNVYNVFLSSMNSENDDQEYTMKLNEARRSELEKLRAFDTYYPVVDSGQKVITTRWVDTVKPDGTMKARLVARGFQETGDIQSDSPTAAKSSLRALLAICAANKWEVQTTDIKSAFLQGRPLERDVYVKPPKGYEKPGIIWKLKKCLYGLCDGARNFYLSVVDKLKELGCIVSNLEPCIFVYIVNGKLEGLIACHVDDFLHSGSSIFVDNVIKPLMKVYKASKHVSRNFTFTGMRITQAQDSTIEVDQDEYLQRWDTSAYKKLVGNANRDLNKDEYAQYREMVGRISWLATTSRPDLAFDSVYLSTKFNCCKAEDYNIALKVVKKAMNFSFHMKFPSSLRANLQGPPGVGPARKEEDSSLRAKLRGPPGVGPARRGEMSLLVYTDASLQNLPKDGSTGGHVIMLYDEINVAPLAWHSARLRRVAKSTITAEALALETGIDEAIYIKELLNTWGIPINRIITLVDNKSLVQSLKATSYSTLEKRLRIEISMIKDTMNSDNVNVAWIPGPRQLADCLTKLGAGSRGLIDMLETGLPNVKMC